VLELGGRYYLPYRLHATQRQFEQAYPQAAKFFEHKRQYDPDELFQNQFYVRYGQPQPGSPRVVPSAGARVHESPATTAEE
jgi:hypothetical protein